MNNSTPEYVQFTIIKSREKQKIISLEELEQDNIVH